jgi:hypothetical protein
MIKATADAIVIALLASALTLEAARTYRRGYVCGRSFGRRYERDLYPFTYWATIAIFSVCAVLLTLSAGTVGLQAIHNPSWSTTTPSFATHVSPTRHGDITLAATLAPPVHPSAFRPSL